MFSSLFKNTVFATGIIAAGVLILSLVSCSERPEPEITVPANSVQALLDALGDNTPVKILGSGDGKGPQIVITPDLSARVLGASIDGLPDENLMWVDETIMKGNFWQKKPYFWNAGGLRSWIKTMLNKMQQQHIPNMRNSEPG